MSKTDIISNINILIPMAVNSLLGITNRVLQIVDYYLNENEKGKYKFIFKEVKFTALTFCILPTAVDIFMISLYSILHYEKMLTPLVKIKNFFLFIISMEFLNPIGVHISLKTKYTYTADNPVITMRLINALHFMLVAIPQLLVVSINCSGKDGFFNPVDIASLIFSIIFIIWSIGYYFVCIIFNDQYDDYLSYCAVKPKNN